MAAAVVGPNASPEKLLLVAVATLATSGAVLPHDGRGGGLEQAELRQEDALLPDEGRRDSSALPLALGACCAVHFGMRASWGPGVLIADKCTDPARPPPPHTHAPPTCIWPLLQMWGEQPRAKAARKAEHGLPSLAAITVVVVVVVRCSCLAAGLRVVVNVV